MASTPCDNCPWRRDAPREHWDPQHFRDIYRNCQDDGLHVMLCHKAMALPEERRGELPCRGWLLVMQGDAIGVRLLLPRGTIKPSDLRPARRCPPLFGSFEEMMAANGVRRPRRNRHPRDRRQD